MKKISPEIITDLLCASADTINRLATYPEIIDVIERQPEPWPWNPRSPALVDAMLTAFGGITGPHLADAMTLTDGTKVWRVVTVSVGEVASLVDETIEPIVSSWAKSPCWDGAEMSPFDLWGLIYQLSAYCKNTNAEGVALWVVEAPEKYRWGYRK